MNRHDRMYEQIKQHGANLNAIFHTHLDDIVLAKKLHSLEIKAHRLATDYCNGENGMDSTEAWEKASQKILHKVFKVLEFSEGHVPVPIFINGDARGYALKISDEYVRENNIKIYLDWGGYGVLAPEFDGN